MMKTVPNGVAYSDTALLSVDSSLGGVRPVVGPAVTQNGPSYLAPVNLYADLSSANAISVDDLRLAFAYQKMLEPRCDLRIEV